MNTAGVERLAAQMLELPPQASIVVDPSARPCAVAVWVGRMYGYTYDETLNISWAGRGTPGMAILGFTRSDEPGARRRGEWMRNPDGDPTYPPPVVWHLNGGPGFHPPGWHPAARIVITPEIEASLRYNAAQFARKLNDHAVYAPYEMSPSFAGLPPTPPPPPPPSTIDYPDARDGRP